MHIGSLVDLDVILIERDRLATQGGQQGCVALDRAAGQHVFIFQDSDDLHNSLRASACARAVGLTQLQSDFRQHGIVGADACQA